MALLLLTCVVPKASSVFVDKMTADVDLLGNLLQDQSEDPIAHLSRRLSAIAGGTPKLGNATFSVLMAEESPWAMYDATKSCTGGGSICKEQFKGICRDLLDRLQAQSDGAFSWDVNNVALLGSTEDSIVSRLESTAVDSDMLCGGLPVSPDALVRDVDYTLPFWSSEIVMIRSKTAPLSPTSIGVLAKNFYKVCVRANSTLLNEVREKYELSTLVETTTHTEMEQQLLSRACDVALETRTVADYIVAASPGCMLAYEPVAHDSAVKIADQQLVSLGLKQGMGSDAHNLSHYISQLQLGTFFPDLRFNYSKQSCTQLDIKNLGEPYPIIEILTVTNPPFVTYDEKVNAKLMKVLSELPNAEARRAYLDSTEGLKLSNSRWSGYIIEMINEIASNEVHLTNGGRMRFRLQASSVTYTTGEPTLRFRGWDMGSYGGGQHFVYNEELRSAYRTERHPYRDASTDDACGGEACMKWCANPGTQVIAGLSLDPNVCYERVHLPDIYWAGYFITSGRLETSDMSGPFLDTGLMIAILKKEKDDWRNNLGTFLEPFSWGLWLAIAMLAFYVGLVFWYLESPRYLVTDQSDFAGGRDDGKGWGRTLTGLRKNFGRTMHLSYGGLSLLFNHTPLSLLGRIFSISYTMFAVIVISAYTANLAAYLTEVSFTAKFETLDELIDNGGRVCVEAGTAYANYLDTYEHSSRRHALTGEALKLNLVRCEGAGVLDTANTVPADPGFGYSRLPMGTPVEQRPTIREAAAFNAVQMKLQQMAEMVTTGECVAMIDVHVLTEFAASTTQFCPLIKVSGAMFWSQNLGIGVNKGLSQVATGLSAHLAALRSNGFLEDLGNRHFSKPQCLDDVEVRQLIVADFLPIFLITALIGIGLLVLEFGGKHMCKRCLQRLFRDRIRRNFEPRDAATLEREMRWKFERRSATSRKAKRGVRGCVGSVMGMLVGLGRVACCGGCRGGRGSLLSLKSRNKRTLSASVLLQAPHTNELTAGDGTSTSQTQQNPMADRIMGRNPSFSKERAQSIQLAERSRVVGREPSAPSSSKSRSRSKSAQSKAGQGALQQTTSRDRRRVTHAQAAATVAAMGSARTGEVRLNRSDFVQFLLHDCPWLDRWQVFGGEKEDGEPATTRVRLWPKGNRSLEQMTPVTQEGGAMLLIDHPRVSPRRSVSWYEFSLWYRDNNLDIKRGFTRYDYMEVGEIERKNFRGLLSAVSESQMDKNEIDAAIEQMDADQGGTIDYEEFLHWYLTEYPLIRMQARMDSALSLSSEEDLRKVFRTHDKVDEVEVKDGSGSLDIHECSMLIVALTKGRVQKFEAESAMRKIDKDRSGGIEEAEFVQWFKKTRAGRNMMKRATILASAPDSRLAGARKSFLPSSSRTNAELTKQAPSPPPPPMFELESAAIATTHKIDEGPKFARI